MTHSKHQSNRLRAAKRGEKRFEGKPCKNCETTTRYTSNGGCVECAKERANAYQKDIRDTLKKNLGKRGRARK